MAYTVNSFPTGSLLTSAKMQSLQDNDDHLYEMPRQLYFERGNLFNLTDSNETEILYFWINSGVTHINVRVGSYYSNNANYFLLHTNANTYTVNSGNTGYTGNNLVGSMEVTNVNTLSTVTWRAGASGGGAQIIVADLTLWTTGSLS